LLSIGRYEKHQFHIYDLEHISGLEKSEEKLYLKYVKCFSSTARLLIKTKRHLDHPKCLIGLPVSHNSQNELPNGMKFAVPIK
jgi:hypothetical protein